MKYRLYDNFNFIFLMVIFFIAILGVVCSLGVSIAVYLHTGPSFDMVLLNALFLPMSGYLILVFCRGWKYYFAVVSIDLDGVMLTNKTNKLFESGWSEITKIYFFVQVVKGFDMVTIYFSKDPTDIEPKELRKRWRMSDKIFHTRIDAAKIGEVLKYCPEEKNVWILDRDCSSERFRKYGIYSYQYKL